MPISTRPGGGVVAIRCAAICGSLAAAIAAFVFFLKFGSAAGLSLIDILRAIFLLVATFWLAWGASQALLGLFLRPATPPHHAAATTPITTRVVVLVPIYEEDPVATFSRIAAMDASLEVLGQTSQFDFAILSDTRDPVTAARERLWYLRLLRDRSGQGRIYYRRRDDNRGRKAGNIEDFIQTSGAAYEFAIILDADSLMEGTTMLEMVARMQADRRLGLLQTLPQMINARTRFARAMQFSAAFNSPVFARGLALLQGQTGPFWGHNAIIRMRAFAQSCGLPDIPGNPPFGGPILSHDYVEAAFLARAGWTVRLDPDLSGSFEEGPATLIDHAKRDRRWCQGNLQHARLLTASGLAGWSRFVFVQGILAYIVSLFWLGFLLTSIIAPAVESQTLYFPVPRWPVPLIYPTETALAVGLFIGIFGLLILPKLLIGADAVLRRRVRHFGGFLRASASVLTELAFSSLIAPILLMFQVRAVLQVFLGRDGGWPAQDREGSHLSLRQAWAHSYWIVTAGLLGLSLAMAMSPGLLLWLLPVALPMLLSPLIIAWSSQPGQGWLFATPEDQAPTPVMRQRAQILQQWQHDGDSAPLPMTTTGQLARG